MKKILIICFLLGNSVTSFAQVNLVPNPSFEDTVACPIVNGYLAKAAKWLSPTNGQGLYFNSCASPSGNFAPYGIPYNSYSYQYPFEGNACVYLALIGLGGGGNGRYYAEAKLTDTLIAGKTYWVSFRLSLADSSAYACDDIGVYFSDSYISSPTIQTNLQYTPQLQNQLSNPLNDKVGWTLVSGIYTALGTEAWLTIGNFKPDSTSNYYAVGGGAPWSAGCGVLIDSFGVSEIITSINDLTINEKSIKIYPNPATGFTKIIFNQPVKTSIDIELYNDFNQLKWNGKTENKNSVEINLSDLSNGIYYVILKNKNSQVIKKIIKL